MNLDKLKAIRQIEMEVSVKAITYPKDKKLIRPGVWARLIAEPKRVITEKVSKSDLLQGNYETIILTGKIPKIVDDSIYKVVAEVNDSPKYGVSFNIIIMKNPDEKLQDGENGRTFLRAILTETQYNNITQLPNPIEVLENGDVETLSKIKGFGKKTAQKIIGKYEANKGASSDILTFSKYDLTEAEIKSIMEYYNDNSTIAIQSIKDNPYCLTDIKGFGFKKVDDIALRNGLVGEHDKRRVKAYIEYLFYDMSNNQGHVWTWTDSVFDCVCSELELEDEEIIAESLRELVNEQVLWTSKEHDKLALKRYRDMEYNIAKELIR